RVNSVEQEFEGSVRLGAPDNFRPKELDAPATYPCIDDFRRLIEILLTPRPTASKRFWRVDPRYRLHALPRRIGQQSECFAVVEKHIGARVETVRQRIGVVDARFDDGARNVELL